MAIYDEDILLKQADNLYTKASNAEALYLIAGLFLGIVAYVATANMNQMGALLFGLMVVAVVYGIGRARAFEFKSRAQMILVLHQIEKNTRP